MSVVDLAKLGLLTERTCGKLKVGVKLNNAPRFKIHLRGAATISFHRGIQRKPRKTCRNPAQLLLPDAPGSRRSAAVGHSPSDMENPSDPSVFR